MYLADIRFAVIADTDLPNAERAIRNYLESLVFQGQLLGREWPTVWQDYGFVTRAILPTIDALAMPHHSARGLEQLQALPQAGLGYPQVTVLGTDLMANHTDPCDSPSALILYTRFNLMNSPLYCAEHFAPVPLFRLTPAADDFEGLIRWQLQYQALDEVQMHEQSLLPGCERALQTPNSLVNKTARQLARQLSKANQRPVYTAIYQGTSDDCQQEPHRRCPSCQGEWRLVAPWHDLFDFRCDQCLLVSNIAWQCQG